MTRQHKKRSKDKGERKDKYKAKTNKKIQMIVLLFRMFTSLSLSQGNAGDHLRPAWQRVEQVRLLEAPGVPQRGGRQRPAGDLHQRQPSPLRQGLRLRRQLPQTDRRRR